MDWSKRAKEFIIPFVREASKGERNVKVYWGGIKGYEDELVRKMQSGELQGAALSGNGATLVCPEFSVLSLPFLFNGYDEVDYLREKIYGTLDQAMLQKGYKLVLWIDQDFDQIYSSKHIPDSLANLRKAKFGQWFGPVEKQVFSTLGISSVPVQVFDIPRRLVDETFDSAIGPALWVLGMQVYPHVKYVLHNTFRYSPVTVMLTKKEWDTLLPEYQKALSERRAEVTTKFAAAARTDSENCLKAMLAYGIQDIRMTAEAEREFKEIAKSSWKIMADDIFPKELLSEIEAHLAGYRAGKGKGR
jgi:TRAP-type C4-dicarboxylate transport system substrate-binding protein